MNTDSPIVFWNRKTGKEEKEKVYGGSLLRWVYGSHFGQLLGEWILTRKFFSKMYGIYQSSWFSRRQIGPFIREYAINQEEFEGASYPSFNAFFIRKFKLGARPFVQESGRMPAFSEGRYLAYERITPWQSFPVKGAALSAQSLLGGVPWARFFEYGPLLLARLCPVDYHRFHFPDDGILLETRSIPGKLHSVNPFALSYKNDIFITNERKISLLETKNFGKLAFIEVGALCVGKIVHAPLKGDPFPAFKRGDEKGYFLFGGSTTLVLGEPNRWIPDADLLEQTQKKRETWLRLGESIATSV